MEKMSFYQAKGIAMAKLNRDITNNEMSDAIGMSRQYISRQKDKPISEEQIIKIEKYFNISLISEDAAKSNSDTSSLYPGKIELKYWGEGLPCEEQLKNPTLTSLMLDREIIYTHWHIKDENELNIIAMPGDKMDGGDRPYKNGDILIIDKSQTDISLSGVYFYTTNDDTEVFVSGLRRTPFSKIAFTFGNSKYEDYEVSVEEYETANIKIIGRVVHNQSEVS